MEEIRNVYRIIVGKPDGTDIGIGVKIVLKWILNRI
jgi:hypothetical protein